VCRGSGQTSRREALLEPIISVILRKASFTDAFDSVLICKRWLATAEQVQEHFQPSAEKQGGEVVRVIRSFQQRAATLKEGTISDYILGAVGVIARSSAPCA